MHTFEYFNKLDKVFRQNLQTTQGILSEFKDPLCAPLQKFWENPALGDCGCCNPGVQLYFKCLEYFM